MYYVGGRIAAGTCEIGYGWKNNLKKKKKTHELEYCVKMNKNHHVRSHVSMSFARSSTMDKRNVQLAYIFAHRTTFDIPLSLSFCIVVSLCMCMFNSSAHRPLN